MPSLIGTLPDQLPTNGDLGELAFQNKDSVEFYDGRGGLQHLALTAIKRNINVTAVDVFVYDTSKDSDGGAWRNRTQHTSWYNETLNTATRGSRREFPSVAVLVATATSVTIYDGDDPAMPMWMVFSASINPMWQLPSLLSSSSTAITCLSAINGIISCGSSPWGLRTLSFIDELSIFREQGYYRRINRPISDRNSLTSTDPLPDLGSSGWLVHDTVNDVAMTVLPNAPIDPATGLPTPTIAVATDGGVSVIKDDGTVKNITHGSSDYSYSYDVRFTKNNQLRVSMDSTSRRFFRTYNIPSANISVDQWTPAADNGPTAYTNYNNGDIAHGGNISATAANAVGTLQSGLTVFEETTSGTTALHSKIGTKYNTGWMVGNGSKGAWLSDTTQETVVGNITPPASSWYAARGASLSVSGNTVTISTQNQMSWQGGALAINGLQIGKQYIARINASTVVNASGSAWYVLRTLNSDGSHSGLLWADDDAYVGAQTTISANTNYYLIWTATATTEYIAIESNSTAAGGQFVFSDFELRQVDQDRSVNNKGLQVFGNITKTPVAAGADLVSYGGFSSSNYLYQPYNSALDFGTGDFCYATWLSNDGSNNLGGIFSRQLLNQSSGNRWQIQMSGGGDIVMYDGINTADISLQVPTGWHQLVFARRSGVVSVYLDGVVRRTHSDTTNYTNSGAPLIIGGLNLNTSTSIVYPYTQGGFALTRVSATAPSAEQVAKMYNDEKYLFQDNAKATLYGTSDAVTALAYDEDTNLLHVGTSSGRSVFNGLRRVDNTTDAVGACISAAGGLVVED